jgi:hypothetical protein
MATMSNLRVRPTLTNISLGYANQQFIADQIFPIVPRDTDTGDFYGSGKEMFTRESDIRGMKDRANAIDHDYRKFSYSAVEHSLLEELPEKLLQQARVSGIAGVVNLERDASNLVTQKLALGREIDFATQLRNTANYASGNSVTLSGTAQWSDYTNSDPVTAVEGYNQVVLDKIGMPPNLAIIPRSVMRKLRYHPQLLNKLGTTPNLKRLAVSEIADLFEVDRILVPDVIYNTAPADLGDTFTTSPVWGKDVMLLRVADRVGLNQLSFGYLFRVRYPTNNNLLAEFRSWEEKDRRISVVEGNYMEDRMIALPEAGYLIKAAIA